MGIYRALLCCAVLTATLNFATSYEPPPRNVRRAQNHPPPLHLFPGPYPPGNAPPRKPSNRVIIGPSGPQRVPSFRPIHGKPPSIPHKYPGGGGNRPFNSPPGSKPKKQFPKGHPGKVKHSFHGHHGPPPQFNRPTPYPKHFHGDENGVPKHTIATFVNRPSHNNQGTPKLTYNGKNRNPTVSFGPPYPPKPFKSYGIPTGDDDEDDYADEESSHQIKYNNNNKAPLPSFNFGKQTAFNTQQGFGGQGTAFTSQGFSNQQPASFNTQHFTSGNGNQNFGTPAATSFNFASQAVNIPAQGNTGYNFPTQGLNFGTQDATSSFNFGSQDTAASLSNFNFGQANVAAAQTPSFNFGAQQVQFAQAASGGGLNFGGQQPGTVDHVGGFPSGPGYGGVQGGATLNYPAATSPHVSVAQLQQGASEVTVGKKKRRRPLRQEDGVAQPGPSAPAPTFFNANPSSPSADQPKQVNDWGDFLMETFTSTVAPTEVVTPAQPPRHRKYPSRKRTTTTRSPLNLYEVTDDPENHADNGGTVWLPTANEKQRRKPWERSGSEPESA